MALRISWSQKILHDWKIAQPMSILSPEEYEHEAGQAAYLEQFAVRDMS